MGEPLKPRLVYCLGCNGINLKAVQLIGTLEFGVETFFCLDCEVTTSAFLLMECVLN